MRPRLPLAALLLLPVLLAGGCRRAERPASPPAPLRIATYSAPLGLDPHLKNEVLTFSILGNIFDALVSFDAQLRVRPALATSWENPNDLTWRFHLRPGVRFHDGRPLTADDVVASLERVRHHPRSGVGNYLVSVDRVRKLSASTIEITTRRPSPVLLNKLTFVYIVPRDAPEEIRQPIGTGPYRFVSMDARRILLRAFTASWRGPPPVAEVEMAIVPDAAARVAMLTRGEVDLIQEVKPELSDRVEQTRGCRLLASEGLLVEYLAVRPDTPPFADLRVRRAIHLAVDRAALVADHLRGHGLPIGQLVGRQVFGYAPDLQLPARDVATARRLLAEAGLPEGFAADLEFREGRSADVLIRQLAEVGIRLRPVPRPWPEMYRRLQEGKVPVYFGGVLAGSADASDVFDSKVHSRDPEHGYGDSNWTGFSDPELDRLIEGSATTMDMLQRRAQLQAVMRRLMEDLPLVPLDNPYTLFGVCNGLRWEPRRDGMVEVFDIGRAPGDRR
ncbi:MAG TPA: ABC transporter substrate-binding protein [Thermoanaerobaculia bacterium]|nr:ABC transporter substrate-binding protein [Thermoanaerobaculia bacterium]